MNHSENQCAEYDIFIIWNFPQGLGLKVKIGSYFPCSPRNQQLTYLKTWSGPREEHQWVPLFFSLSIF